MCIAAAIAGSAVVGAGASVYGSKQASKAASRGADAATLEQQRQFDQLREDQAPYRDAGYAALGDLSALRTGDLSRFYASPDYTFNLQQGQQAIDRSLVARGGALSGAAVKEGQRYASGLASSEFGNYFNRLAAQAGIGQAATNFTGQAGMNAAANIGNIQQNLGAARGSAYQSMAAGVNGALQGGASNYLLTQYLQPQTAATPSYYGANYRGPLYGGGLA